MGDAFEKNGTPTNIQLTNEQGKIDLGIAFSNRNGDLQD